MAVKCPECGRTLKFWNFRAECPDCKTNIPNYHWQERLERDADTAETAYAKMHYKLNNFKSSVVGSKLRIVRLVMTFAPLIALVLPLYNFKLTLPFLEETRTVSFLTFILDYLTKADIGSVLKLVGGEVVGAAVLTLVIACGLLLISVVCGVLNFFVLLVSGIKMNYLFNVILNAISTVAFAVSAVFFALFTNNCAELGGGIVTEGSLGFGFIVGTALFAVNLILNVAVGKGLRKQYESQPSLSEFVEKELSELHN